MAAPSMRAAEKYVKSREIKIHVGPSREDLEQILDLGRLRGLKVGCDTYAANPSELQRCIDNTINKYSDKIDAVSHLKILVHEGVDEVAFHIDAEHLCTGTVRLANVHLSALAPCALSTASTLFGTPIWDWKNDNDDGRVKCPCNKTHRVAIDGFHKPVLSWPVSRPGGALDDDSSDQSEVPKLNEPNKVFIHQTKTWDSVAPPVHVPEPPRDNDSFVLKSNTWQVTSTSRAARPPGARSPRLSPKYDFLRTSFFKDLLKPPPVNEEESEYKPKMTANKDTSAAPNQHRRRGRPRLRVSSEEESDSDTIDTLLRTAVDAPTVMGFPPFDFSEARPASGSRQYGRNSEKKSAAEENGIFYQFYKKHGALRHDRKHPNRVEGKRRRSPPESRNSDRVAKRQSTAKQTRPIIVSKHDRRHSGPKFAVEEETILENDDHTVKVIADTPVDHLSVLDCSMAKPHDLTRTSSSGSQKTRRMSNASTQTLPEAIGIGLSRCSTFVPDTPPSPRPNFTPTPTESVPFLMHLVYVSGFLCALGAVSQAFLQLQTPDPPEVNLSEYMMEVFLSASCANGPNDGVSELSDRHSSPTLPMKKHNVIIPSVTVVDVTEDDTTSEYDTAEDGNAEDNTADDDWGCHY